uniref:FAD-binding domain-containing protein n=1 Tax=Timema tahoe TaxID=61484 RepID=A0A7R9FEF4_9NEOP|nr:unnamed protein product [Timema tahoe]
MSYSSCVTDVRQSEQFRGRSINLAMSVRGRTALKEVGLEKVIVKHGIPMKGRMVHAVNGERRPILYDPNNKQVELEDPRNKQVELEDPRINSNKQVELEDPRNKQVELEDPRNKQVELEDPNSIQVELEDPSNKQVELEDPRNKQVELEDPNNIQVELEDPSNKQVELEDPRNKQVELEDPSNKQVELEDSSKKQVELEDPKSKQVELEDPSKKQVELEDPSKKQVELEDPSNKHGVLEDPSNKPVGLEDPSNKHGVLEDPSNKPSIYSVSRKFLNELLLTAAEKDPNVHFHFHHKLVAADLDTGSTTFHRAGQSEAVSETADLVVGADGAFSTIRRQLMKRPGFDYSQRYIEHGYLELCIPPTEDGEFAMEQNYLHIWPRGTFMMIALPNQDRSWTVTLFMPFHKFDSLDTPEKLIEFFSECFPDAVALIGQEQLVRDFFATRPSSLVSVKVRDISREKKVKGVSRSYSGSVGNCKPYHIGCTALIIGDAAHAMVPFYGQGMNAGFEDCRLLDELMERHNDDLSLVLPEFSQTRNEDAEAICDLAMYNYIEMRDLVNKRSFLWRKKLDELLFWLFPRQWVPLYTSVTFSNMSYTKCLSNKQWQDKGVSGGGGCGGGRRAMAAARWPKLPGSNSSSHTKSFFSFLSVSFSTVRSPFLFLLLLLLLCGGGVSAAKKQPPASGGGAAGAKDVESVIEEVTSKQLEKVLNEKDFVAVFW